MVTVNSDIQTSSSVTFCIRQWSSAASAVVGTEQPLSKWSYNGTIFSPFFSSALQEYVPLCFFPCWHFSRICQRWHWAVVIRHYLRVRTCRGLVTSLFTLDVFIPTVLHITVLKSNQLNFVCSCHRAESSWVWVNILHITDCLAVLWCSRAKYCILHLTSVYRWWS